MIDKIKLIKGLQVLVLSAALAAGAAVVDVSSKIVSKESSPKVLLATTIINMFLPSIISLGRKKRDSMLGGL